MQEPDPPPIEFMAAFIEDMEAAAAAADPITDAELKPALCGDTEDMPPIPWTIEFIAVYEGAIGLRFPFDELCGTLPFVSGPPPLPPTNPGVLLPLLFVASGLDETSE